MAAASSSVWRVAKKNAGARSQGEKGKLQTASGGLTEKMKKSLPHVCQSEGGLKVYFASIWDVGPCWSWKVLLSWLCFGLSFILYNFV